MSGFHSIHTMAGFHKLLVALNDCLDFSNTILFVFLINQPPGTKLPQSPILHKLKVPQLGQDSQNVQMNSAQTTSPDPSYECNPGFYNQDQQQGYQR
jgi:hypothetical protein